MHSNVHIGQKSVIHNYVFIYPYVILTNDPTPPSDALMGVTIHNYAQIATLSVVLPGITIYENALVGAGSVVTKDVPSYILAAGNPAKNVKDVREIKDRTTGESYYPWMQRFTRGMPWHEIGYNKWNESNK